MALSQSVNSFTPNNSLPHLLLIGPTKSQCGTPRKDPCRIAVTQPIRHGRSDRPINKGQHIPANQLRANVPAQTSRN